MIGVVPSQLRYAVIALKGGKYLLLGHNRKTEPLDSMMEYIRGRPLMGSISVWAKAKTVLMISGDGELPPKPWTLEHRMGAGAWPEMVDLLETCARML